MPNVDPLALYGAVIATLAAALSILNFRRDRARVKIEVSRGYLLDGDGGRSESYLFVRGVNVGRRPVLFTEAGVVVPRKDRLMIMPPLTGSPFEAYSLPKLVPEAGQTQLWTKMSELANNIVIHADGRLPTHGYFDDSSGRRWKGRIPEYVLNELRVLVNAEAAFARRR
jgi:hypothetical protein